LGLIGLALLDSINPSAIAVTVFLMAQPRFAACAAVYIGAVFATYLGLGLAILLGLDAAWAFLDGTRTGWILQVLMGAVLLGYAVLASEPKVATEVPVEGRGLSLPAVAMLGASVTIAEFTTAMPYLGAIALLADATPSFATKLVLLLSYNLVFVLPPILLAVAYLALGERVRPLFERWGEKLRAGAHTMVLWLMGAAGFLLLGNGLVPLARDLGWFR
jgi:cytochrome c biogenesis protein CcdA